ncbi:PilC/PilY family type IV pilus protein [uncultured Thiodictyon sp.]|jgi:type IV pilus assembly protein PilY1|uniref:pilus assembly protein n=1 Tax=uncultured Thiodictyon sp. TaxID=1846217 RepID=UPI0025F6B52C|nr:PilC/PilY family type IV pilus protein [uncultured Thiodictyon sp.]
MSHHFSTAAALTCLALVLAEGVQGAPVDLATSPLVTSAAVVTLPNLMFVLDDSGSMVWTHMPDDNNDAGSTVTFNYGYYGYRSSQCNGVYYNPAFTYKPPIGADGTIYPNASFTAAWVDGYKKSSGTVNLSSNFTAETDSSGTAAYYYRYSGAQDTAAEKDYNSITSLFFLECHNSESWPDSSWPLALREPIVFTKVTVGTGSDATDAAAKQQNFANWYSYYRSRILTMKTAAGWAFHGIDDRYRVGFMAINNDASFLNLAPFNSTQKSSWYGKLYAIAPSGNTPLRTALAKAGWLYAGKLPGATDPVQYSCQQNFTILSTDGFWNSGEGYILDTKLDGTKILVGNQDGTEARPFYDGTKSTTTSTTPIVTIVRNETVTQTTTTTPYTRKRKTTDLSTGGENCGSKYRTVTQPQTYNRKKIVTVTVVTDVTTTNNHVVVTTNGEVVDKTVLGSPVSAQVSSTSANSDTGAPVVTTVWTNTGTATAACNSNPTPSPGLSSAPAAVAGTSSVATTETVNVLSTTGPTVGITVTPIPVVTGETKDTLSDIAQYYFVTDLRTAARGNCVGALGSGHDVCLNNVPAGGQDAASWQHMTTFTLGLGARGRMVFSQSYLSDVSGDYRDVKNGTAANAPVCSWQTSGACNWPVPGMANSSDGKIENIDDVWHAAVNGRGTYFSATDPATLTTGLGNAVAGVSARIGAAAAAATSNPNVSAGDNYVFSSTFTTVNWDGELIRQQLDLTTGTLSDTIDWHAQALLDENTSRTIWTYDNAVTSTDHIKEFSWENLTATERAYFSKSAIATLSQFCVTEATCLSLDDQDTAAGENLVDFLRGVRTYEGPIIDPTHWYRQRTHLLGDIVSSEAVFVRASLYRYTDTGYGDFITETAARQGMIYVGANDGMLHAIDGTTGAESWAYIPGLVLPNLFKLADKNYSAQHAFFVDGSPVQGDVYYDLNWHTILVGGLNNGGRGYYALDITDPSAPTVLWEFTDTNLGYTYGNPIITKLKDGTWVVLIASGYNNVSPGDGVGRLYVLDARTGASIRQITTGAGGTATPSGLARINAWVNNTMIDNTALRVYGGDLLGNLWRFDINGDVGAAGFDAQLLATLKDASGNAQPITARPELGEASGYAVIYVGTGRFLGTTDLTNTSQQSMYAIKDSLLTNTTPAVAVYSNPRTGGNFVQQTQTTGTCASGTVFCSTGQIVRTSTNLAVSFSANGGWFVDLPDTGERANTDPTLVLGTLVFTTNKPDASECTAGGYSNLYALSYMTGGAVSTAITTVVAKAIGNAFATRPTIVQLPNLTLRALIRLSDGSTVISDFPIALGSGNTRRVSWRELITE